VILDPRRSTSIEVGRTAAIDGIDVFVPMIPTGAIAGFEIEESEQLLGDSSDKKRH
jgi:hypothetical protein